MNDAIQIAWFALLSGGTVRALYEIMSYGSGGENRFNRPFIIIRYPRIADLATLLLPIVFALIGYVGHKINGLSGLFAAIAATLFLGCPLMAFVLKNRGTQSSIYYSSPFVQLVIFLPFLCFLALGL